MPVCLKRAECGSGIDLKRLAEKCTNYGKRTLAGYQGSWDKPDMMEIYQMAY